MVVRVTSNPDDWLMAIKSAVLVAYILIIMNPQSVLNVYFGTICLTRVLVPPMR